MRTYLMTRTEYEAKINAITKKQNEIREKEAEIKTAINIMTCESRDALAQAEKIVEYAKELEQLKHAFLQQAKLRKEISKEFTK